MLPNQISVRFQCHRHIENLYWGPGDATAQITLVKNKIQVSLYFLWKKGGTHFFALLEPIRNTSITFSQRQRSQQIPTFPRMIDCNSWHTFVYNFFYYKRNVELFSMIVANDCPFSTRVEVWSTIAKKVDFGLSTGQITIWVTSLCAGYIVPSYFVKSNFEIKGNWQNIGKLLPGEMVYSLTARI